MAGIGAALGPPMPIGPDAGPHTGGMPAPPQANPARPNDGLGARWSNWLSNPENGNMMLQMGINLMQPRAIGQSVGGQIGQAVGAGFEARDRSRKATMEQAKEAQALAAQTEDQSIQRQGLKLRIRAQDFDESSKKTDQERQDKATGIQEKRLGLQRAAAINSRIKDLFSQQLTGGVDENLTPDQIHEMAVAQVDAETGFDGGDNIPPPATSGPPLITTAAEYAALPAGAQYLDGKTNPPVPKRKGGSPPTTGAEH